jgi:apolipoprotein N-acyltransferase
LAEIVRGTLWTGFPWGAVGYAHIDSLFQHWAPWVGVYGMCALSAFIVMAVAAERKDSRPIARKTQLSIAAIVAVLGYTWFTSPSQSSNEATLSASPIRSLAKASTAHCVITEKPCYQAPAISQLRPKQQSR